MQLSFEEIKELIPQRFPFIMIDKVLELDPGKYALAVKNVSGNDIFFLGHFPDKAIMPGAAIIEAMAQTAIVLFASSSLSLDSTLTEGVRQSSKPPIYYFGSVKARFLHPVVPGDQIKIKVVNIKTLPTTAYVSGEVFVDEKKIAEGELVFSVGKDEK
jgi:3-hydroxyacyl-[acyl-carrier-protein] dehydratase